MKPQEINWNEWEECDHDLVRDCQTMSIAIYAAGSIMAKIHYFKKKEVFPKVFENDIFRFIVYKTGTLSLYDKLQQRGISLYDSLPLLSEAEECAKKQREKNK